jgi:hypothetical protein
MGLMDTNEAVLRLREQLGLIAQNQSQQPTKLKQAAQALAARTRRPGQRRPTRDIIGRQEVLHAAHA